MPVFQMYSTTIGLNGKPYGFCFEHPATDLRDLFEQARKDGLIYGERLRTVDDGRGRRMITARTPVVIGLASLASIENPPLAHWEPEEDAA